MNYHVNTIAKRVERPDFVVLNGTLVVPQKVYTKEEYPNLKTDMVKITSQDGRNIFVPISKLANIG